ncbi:hypothetical protein ACLHIJ_00165 [Trueperella sp. LYQ141]
MGDESDFAGDVTWRDGDPFGEVSKIGVVVMPVQVRRVVLQHSQVRAFLRSDEVRDLVGECAEEIAGRAGEGYASETWMGRSRVIGSAYTDSVRAMVDCAKNQTLLHALGRSS